MNEVSFKDYITNQKLGRESNVSLPVQKENKLPYHKISWKDFELLCTRLANEHYTISRLYLGVGQKQDGIDIYCYQVFETEATCIQCKLHAEFTATDLSNAVAEFVGGAWFDKTKEFIVCIQQETHENRKLVEEYERQRSFLLEKNVEFRLWDGIELDRMLRTKPQLVYEFFDRGISPNWVRSFCGDIYADELISKSKPIPEAKVYPLVENYVQRYCKVTHSPQLNDVLKSGRWTLTHLMTDKAFDNTHFLIRSTAGTGKTIELKYLAGDTKNITRGYFPIFITLKNFTGKDDQSLKSLISSQVKDWQNIPQSQLVLLMDGLDEVPEHSVTTLKQQINLLAGEYSRSRILVSTRSNQYQLSGNENELEGFHTVRLLPLEKDDIQQYIRKHSSDSSDALYNLIENTSLIDLVQIPFYLKHIVDIYNDTGAVPETNKKLFDSLLQKVTDADRNHYRMHGDILPIISKRIKLAERLAFTMSLMGVRQLPEEKVVPIILEDNRDILKRFFLLHCGDSPEYHWEFVHNNFQEYLAARILATLPISEIQKLITFQGSVFIKPKWRNILTLLVGSFSVDDTKGQELIDWLAESQPMALLKVEHDKLGTEKRLQIFKRIYEYYKNLGIYLHHSDYSAESLVNFVGESRELVQFLFGEMTTCPSEDLRLAVYDALIEYEGSLFDFTNPILERARDVLKSQSGTFGLAKRALRLAVKREDDLSNLIQLVQEQSPFRDNHEFCDEIYRHLSESNKFEDHIDFILDGFERYSKYRREASISVVQSEYALLQCLTNSKSSHSILKILARYIQNIELLNAGEIEARDFLTETFLHNVAGAYFREPLIFEKMLELLESLDGKYLLSPYYQLDITPFFTESGTSFRAYEILYQKAISNPKDGREVLYCYVATKESLLPMIQKYLEQVIDDSAIWSVFTGLGYYSKQELYRWFYDEVNLKTGNKFVPKPQFDWEEHRKQQYEGDLALLLDREKFVRAVHQIFAIIGKDQISLADTTAIRGEMLHLDNNLKNTVALSVVRGCLHDDPSITVDRAVKWSEDSERWDWYVAKRLCYFLKQKTAIPDTAITVLKNWLNKNLLVVSFKDAVTETGSRTTVKQREALFVSIYKLVAIEIPENVMLDMLSFDFSGYSNLSIETDNKESERLSSVILKRINDKNLVPIRVLSNLKEGLNASGVLENHIRLCDELKITEAAPLILDVILSNKIADYHTVKTIEIYLNLGGTLEMLLPILTSEYSSFSWHYDFAKKMLNSYKHETIEWIVKGIKTRGYSNNDYLASYSLLITQGHLDGIFHLTNWIKANKALPDRSDLRDLRNYNPADVVPLLLDVLKDAYVNTYSQDVFRPYSMIIDLGFSMAKQNDDLFHYIKDEFRKFISENKAMYAEVNKLEYTIERHITNYYVNKPEQVTLEEARKIADMLMVN
jgi:hypothetical protein